MQKKISIIMGIHNCEETLPEAIDSILKQTCSNWQLIMCDDGSTDNTFQIANLYRDCYPDKIVLIKNQTNRGLNYTLNQCLKYADTEYIARMDGDDISLPNRLEVESDFLDKHPEYDIVSSPMIYFDSYGEWGRFEGNGEFDIKNIAKGTPFCHAPCMVRKTAFDDVGGYAVSNKLLRVEDYDLWIRMLEKGHEGYNLKEPLYMVRDDRNAVQRRKYKYRINEARVKIKAIKVFRLSKKNYFYVIQPLLVGLLPYGIYVKLHQKRFS